MSHIFLALLALSPPVSAAQPSSQSPADEARGWGHSHLGSAYDEGPRQAPWKMEGVGSVSFPITTSHGEGQAWFNQGVALLHGYWPHEAERAFRWVAHLDTDCAMAYWGLAKCARRDLDRASDFLAQAMERADDVSARERAFMDLEAALQAVRRAKRGKADNLEELEHEAEYLSDRLVMDYPDDLEALAFASGAAVEEWEGENRLAVESMLQRILERDPDHVGALHYRIHNWDGEDGHYAIDSCLALTATAPESGHLQHMPGHVLSSIGMWHEAAIAQDAATRVEQRYMRRRCVLPEDNWNYPHNLDYLAYIQGQLGMHEAALTTVQQLIVIPHSSDGRGDHPAGAVFGGFWRLGVMREFIRAKRWNEILDGELLDWPEVGPPGVQLLRAYSETHAYRALGQFDKAEEGLGRVKAARESLLGMMQKELPGGMQIPAEALEQAVSYLTLPEDELDALLTLDRGDSLEGIRLLTAYAERQEKVWVSDPTPMPYFGFNLLGDALLELGSPKLAAEAYERTLNTVFHDGLALAGLVACYKDLGREVDASHAMAALEVVWAEADAGHAQLASARATGVIAADTDLPEPFLAPMLQRRYGAEVLDKVGPCLYLPPVAPAFSAVDADGEAVTLNRNGDRAHLVLFYLGGECVHCIDQLKIANERAEKFADLGVDILAISKDTVEKNAGAQAEFQLKLLSDPDFITARRYGSYDDFEEVELHSTVLIDAQGQIQFIRTGGDPFMDFDFLEREAARLKSGGAIHEIRERLAAE